MLVIILPQMNQKPFPGKVNPFSFNACAIIVNQVFPHRRCQNFITQGVFGYSVLYLFSRNPPNLSSFMQGKLCTGLEGVTITSVTQPTQTGSSFQTSVPAASNRYLVWLLENSHRVHFHQISHADNLFHHYWYSRKSGCRVSYLP